MRVSLRLKWIGMVLGVSVIGLGITLWSVTQSQQWVNENQRLLDQTAKAAVATKTQSTAAEMDALLRAKAEIPATLAQTLSGLYAEGKKGQLDQVEMLTLADNQIRDAQTAHMADVVSVKYALAKNVLPDVAFFMPWWTVNSGKVEQVTPDFTNYQYNEGHDPAYAWYWGPIEKDGLYWTKPYFDEGGRKVNLVAVSAPIKVDGQAIGTVNVDLDLSVLTQKVGAVKLGKTGYAFMADRDGAIIANPDEKLLLKANVNTVLDGALAAVGKKMLAGQSGIDVVKIQGRSYYAGYAPVTAAGYAVGTLVPVAELRAGSQGANIYATALAALGGATLLILLLTLILSSRLTRPLRLLTAQLERVAAGDLTVEPLQLRTRDEVQMLADRMGQMVVHLRTLIRGVHQSADQVAAASNAIAQAAHGSAQGVGGAAAAVQQLASAAVGQAELADEVQDTMGQLGATIHQIADGSQQTAGQVQRAAALLHEVVSGIEQVAGSAQEVAQEATEAAATARSGADVMTRTVSGMARIRQVVGETAALFGDLDKFSAQIGEITHVISAIAEQTNMLALNAAIEAARAGQHGRGFAVVAEEVRRLAERSATSAQEITGLLENIQTRTVDAVRAMEAGTSEVEAGSSLAAEAGRALGEILHRVEQAAHGVQTISTATERVRTSAGHVVKAFDSVAAVTEESSAATEEMAAGAAEVTRAIDRVSGLARTNAGTASEVAVGVGELNAASEQVAMAAGQLRHVAADLAERMAQFRV